MRFTGVSPASRLDHALAGRTSEVTASENGDTVATLRARLQRTEQQASARQHQLERYAADLREVFKQERSRAQELRESYKATVQALSNAVEARDAYTGTHAERATAGSTPPPCRRSSSASCCTTSARSACRTRSSSSRARSARTSSR